MLHLKPFEHFDANTVEEVVSRADEGSKLIAGGTDCLSILKNRVLTTYPEVLINIKTIPGLSYIHEDTTGLKLGALTTLEEITESQIVKAHYSILADAAEAVASPQIRSMGTLGGNLCQDVRCWYYRCSPLAGKNYHCYRKGGRKCFAVEGDNRYHAILEGKACFAVCPSDTAVALTALDAKIKIKGTAGEKIIPVKDFYRTMGNVLKSNQIVTEIQVPKPPEGSRQSFLKFSLRKAMDFAIVSVAAVVTLKGGVCTDARIALGAVAPTPLRATKAEEAIKGKIINAATAGEAAKAAVTGAAPLSRNAYKVAITKTLVKRAILT